MGVAAGRSCNSRDFLGALLSVALTLMAMAACGPDVADVDEAWQAAAQRGTTGPTIVLLAPTPTPDMSPLEALYFPTVYVSPSLEEQVFESEVIVRASLLSTAAATEPVPSDPGVAPTYRPVQVLTFQADEYLKGSGPRELEVRVKSNLTYLTGKEALDIATSILAERNATWDDREGILFLNSSQTPNSGLARSSGGQGAGQGRAVHIHALQ